MSTEYVKGQFKVGDKVQFTEKGAGPFHKGDFGWVVQTDVTFSPHVAKEKTQKVGDCDGNDYDARTKAHGHDCYWVWFYYDTGLRVVNKKPTILIMR